MEMDNTGKNSQETLMPNVATGSGDPANAKMRSTESPAPMTEREQNLKDVERGRRSPMADREIAQAAWEASAERHDDVRDALGKMLSWVDELVCFISPLKTGS
jgi:hypothetical protein